MLFVLIFFLLYLAPVLPVARRVEYVRTLPKRQYVNATRMVTKRSSYGLYINGDIINRTSVCDNCGGDKDFHKGGAYQTLRNYGAESRYKVCENFRMWDGVSNAWGGEWKYVEQSPKVLSSLGIATALWMPLVILEAAKVTAAKVEYNPKSFAKPYHGAETLDQKVTRMEAEATIRDAEIKRLENLNNIKEIS